MMSAEWTQGHCVMALGAAVGEEALFRSDNTLRKRLHFLSLDQPIASERCPPLRGPALSYRLIIRGFMQEALVPLLAGGPAPPAAAAIAFTSLAFGALHAVTPISFYWAVAASVLLGSFPLSCLDILTYPAPPCHIQLGLILRVSAVAPF